MVQIEEKYCLNCCEKKGMIFITMIEEGVLYTCPTCPEDYNFNKYTHAVKKKYGYKTLTKNEDQEILYMDDSENEQIILLQIWDQGDYQSCDDDSSEVFLNKSDISRLNDLFGKK
jgi:hypothetical protein